MSDQSDDAHWDWSNVPDGSAREMLRQGEVRIADLLAVSIASDQRATALGSAFGALAAGLFAADATLLTIQRFDLAASLGIGIAALGSLLASLLCFYAGRPVNFFVGGYEPRKLLSSATDEEWMIRYICQDMQDRIEEDKKVLNRSARLTSVATIVEIGSVIVAAVAFAILHLVR